MSLPIFKDASQTLMLLQTSWSAEINPVISMPANNPVIISGIPLKNGITVINHKLGRKPQGWKVVDIDGAASIYRSGPLNSLTLTLTSSAAVTIALEVF